MGVTEAVAVLEGEGEAPRDRVALDEKETEGVLDKEGAMEPPLRGEVERGRASFSRLLRRMLWRALHAFHPLLKLTCS